MKIMVSRKRVYKIRPGKGKERDEMSWATFRRKWQHRMNIKLPIQNKKIIQQAGHATVYASSPRFFSGLLQSISSCGNPTNLLPCVKHLKAKNSIKQHQNYHMQKMRQKRKNGLVVHPANMGDS